jgi:hypothetical protein
MVKSRESAVAVSGGKEQGQAVADGAAAPLVAAPRLPDGQVVDAKNTLQTHQKASDNVNGNGGNRETNGVTLNQAESAKDAIAPPRLFNGQVANYKNTLFNDDNPNTRGGGGGQGNHHVESSGGGDGGGNGGGGDFLNQKDVTIQANTPILVDAYHHPPVLYPPPHQNLSFVTLFRAKWHKRW